MTKQTDNSTAAKWWSDNRDNFVKGFTGTGLATQSEYDFPAALKAYAAGLTAVAGPVCPKCGSLELKITAHGDVFLFIHCQKCPANFTCQPRPDVKVAIKKEMEWLVDSWRTRGIITLAEAEFALSNLAESLCAAPSTQPLSNFESLWRKAQEHTKVIAEDRIAKNIAGRPFDWGKARAEFIYNQIAAPSTTEDVRPTYEQLQKALVIALDGYEPIEKDMGEIADKYDSGGEPEYPNDPRHNKARSIQHHILGLRIFVEETLGGDPMGGPDKTNALCGTAPSKDVETQCIYCATLCSKSPTGQHVYRTEPATGDVETLAREIAEHLWPNMPRTHAEKIPGIAAILSRRSVEPQVVEMRLCESERLFIKPDQLYRFSVAENCQRCKEIAEAGADRPAPKEKNNG